MFKEYCTVFATGSDVIPSCTCPDWLSAKEVSPSCDNPSPTLPRTSAAWVQKNVPPPWHCTIYAHSPTAPNSGRPAARVQKIVAPPWHSTDYPGLSRMARVLAHVVVLVIEPTIIRAIYVFIRVGPLTLWSANSM